MILENAHFYHFKNLIYDLTGIHISNEKKELVRNRLIKRLRRLNLNSLSDYYYYIKDKNNSNELENFINALSTNKTDFFRESSHFDFISQVLKTKYSNYYLEAGYIFFNTAYYTFISCIR